MAQMPYKYFSLTPLLTSRVSPHFSITGLSPCPASLALRLEVSDLSHEKLVEDWSEVFPVESWPSQVTHLHAELRTKYPRISEADQLYRLLIPFMSITTLSIANEPLLPALLPAGVVPRRQKPRSTSSRRMLI